MISLVLLPAEKPPWRHSCPRNMESPVSRRTISYGNGRKAATSGGRTRQRDRLFAEILAGESWIVEGSPRACLNESFDVCDYIILLDVSTFVRLKRVFLRWIRQRKGRERCNTAPTLAFLLDNLKWVFEFNRKKKSIIKRLSEHGDRFRVFNSQEAAIRFIESRCAPEKEN